MPDYSVLIHLDLLEVAPKRGKQRELIMDFIRSLAESPDTHGDFFTDQDEELRIRQVKIVGKYAITYWADHPAKSVIIVDVKIADR